MSKQNLSLGLTRSLLVAEIVWVDEIQEVVQNKKSQGWGKMDPIEIGVSGINLK